MSDSITLMCVFCRDLYSRSLLDGYLSRALNVELENGRLTSIDDSAYVLTLDYTIKMLNINERWELHSRAHQSASVVLHGVLLQVCVWSSCDH